VEISREYGSTLPGSCIRIQTTTGHPAELRAQLETRVQWN
jgi:hypothetical protein